MCDCESVHFLSVLTCTSESALTGCSWNQVSLPWYFCRSSFFTATLPTHTLTQKKKKNWDSNPIHGPEIFSRKQQRTQTHLIQPTCQYPILIYASTRCWITHVQLPGNDSRISTLKLASYVSLENTHRYVNQSNDRAEDKNHTLQEAFQFVVYWSHSFPNTNTNQLIYTLTHPLQKQKYPPANRQRKNR